MRGNEQATWFNPDVGTVKDSTGGAMVPASVTLNNPVSGFRRESATDESGRFVFRNVPRNPYHLEIIAQGFQSIERDVEVNGSVPIEATVGESDLN